MRSLKKITPRDKFLTRAEKIYRELGRLIADIEAETDRSSRRSGRVVFDDPITGKKHTIKTNRQ